MSAGPAAAQARGGDYPAKPIRLIVPLAAGSVPDLRARQLGTRMAATLGQQLVIDNRPGAGGNIGTAIAARAVPDGYTLLFGGLSVFAINVALYAKLPFDPVRDFDAVGFTGTAPFTLMVNPSLPVRSVQELVALAQAKPGTLTYASLGPGSLFHLAAEHFRSTARAELRHVPFREYSTLTTDLLAGRVDAFFDSLIAMGQHVKAGRLRALAASGAVRLPAFPDVPTFAEAGFPGYEVIAWSGILAPARTPAPVVARLNSAINAAMAAPDIRDALFAAGGFPLTGTPGDLAERIRTERPRWARIVRESGALAE